MLNVDLEGYRISPPISPGIIHGPIPWGGGGLYAGQKSQMTDKIRQNENRFLKKCNEENVSHYSTIYSSYVQ